MSFAQFLSQALAALTAVGALLAVVIPVLRPYIKSASLAKGLDIAEKLAAAAVANAQQSTVAGLKDPAQPGEWTPSAASKVKDRVVEEVKNNAPGMVEELRSLGIAWPNALIGQLVERQVVAQKVERAPPTQPASALPVSASPESIAMRGVGP